MSRQPLAEMNEADYANVMASLDVAKEAAKNRDVGMIIILLNNAENILEKYKPESIKEREGGLR